MTSLIVSKSRHCTSFAFVEDNPLPPRLGIHMPDRYPIFGIELNKRRRKWRWRVCAAEGEAVMQGAESSRMAAKYQANRALFLLLLTAPYQSERFRQEARARR